MMKASKNFINNPLPNVATKTDYEAQAALTQQLVTAAQNGDKAALEQLCIFYEPLFRREMKREIFYKGLGYEEGLSLARLKFIELVLNYNVQILRTLPVMLDAEFITLYMMQCAKFGRKKKTPPPCPPVTMRICRRLQITLLSARNLPFC